MGFNFLADTLQLIADTLANGALNDDGVLEIDPDDAREIQERLELMAGIGLKQPLAGAKEDRND
jgi:hypothetical protein